MSRLLQIITSSDEERNTSLDSICQNATFAELLEECTALDDFRRKCDNLYQRVRTLFFLYAIHRFHIPRLVSSTSSAQIPFYGYHDLLERRFEEVHLNLSDCTGKARFERIHFKCAGGRL